MILFHCRTGITDPSSSLIKGFGFTPTYTALLQLPVGVVEFLVVPACGLAATYIRDVRCLIMALISLVPLGGLFGIRFLGLDDRWGLIACTWLQGILGAPTILCMNLLTTNIAGHTKRSATNGVWFLFYGAGNIIGANIFFAREAPRYFSALAGLIGCYCGIIAIAALLGSYMMWENRRRDNLLSTEGLIHGAEAQAIMEGFQNRTDKESQGFRYCL